MKKAELASGRSYWISKDNDWKVSGIGFVGTFTGFTDGLYAEIQTPSVGPDDDGLERVMFVHIRATLEKAEELLSGVWEQKRRVDEKREAFQKRAKFLGCNEIVGVSNGLVHMSWTDFDHLTRLARKGMDK